MPKVAYYVDDSNSDPIEIDRRTVDACEDAALLWEWLGDLEDLEETVQMQTRAFHLNPNDSQESLLWLGRANKALAAAGIGRSRVRRRLMALGEIDDSQVSQIKGLEEKLANAKARIAVLEAEKADV